MQQIVIIGAGGFGAEVAWVCRRAGIDVIGFCDDAAELQSGGLAGLPLLGAVEQAAATLASGTGCHIAVGDNRARLRLHERSRALGWRPVTVVDPTAVVAPDAVLGDGCFVGCGSLVSCATRVGGLVIINHQSTIGHDCVVGDYAQICPGARVSGACRIGEGALLGSNAVTIPGAGVGAWATLGAGAVALRGIPAGQGRVKLR